MTEIIFLVEEDIEGGYSARALDHSIFTDAETWNELKTMIQDAVNCHFEPEERPKLFRLHHPLKVVTLNAILRDVAQYIVSSLKISVYPHLPHSHIRK